METKLNDSGEPPSPKLWFCSSLQGSSETFAWLFHGNVTDAMAFRLCDTRTPPQRKSNHSASAIAFFQCNGNAPLKCMILYDLLMRYMRYHIKQGGAGRRQLCLRACQAVRVEFWRGSPLSHFLRAGLIGTGRFQWPRVPRDLAP